MKKQISKRKKKIELHLTRPPRLEGKSKNAMMNPIRKKGRSVKEIRKKRDYLNKP